MQHYTAHSFPISDLALQRFSAYILHFRINYQMYNIPDKHIKSHHRQKKFLFPYHVELIYHFLRFHNFL